MSYKSEASELQSWQLNLSRKTRENQQDESAMEKEIRRINATWEAEQRAAALANRQLAAEHAILLAQKALVIKRLEDEHTKLKEQHAIEQQTGGYFEVIMHYFLGREKPNLEKMTDFCKLCAHIMDRSVPYEPEAFPPTMLPWTDIVLRTAHYQEKRAPLLILKDSTDPAHKERLENMCKKFLEELQRKSSDEKLDKERALACAILRDIEAFQHSIGTKPEETAACASRAASSKKPAAASSLFAPATDSEIPAAVEMPGACRAVETTGDDTDQDNSQLRADNITRRQALVETITHQQKSPPEYTQTQLKARGNYGAHTPMVSAAEKKCHEARATMIAENKQLTLRQLQELIGKDEQIQEMENKNKTVTAQLIVKPKKGAKEMALLQDEYLVLQKEQRSLLPACAPLSPPAYQLTP